MENEQLLEDCKEILTDLEKIAAMIKELEKKDPETAKVFYALFLFTTKLVSVGRRSV